MLTTCPECHTTFRVAQDQLERRSGLVRCGYCRAVFNAFDTLLPEFETQTPVKVADVESAPAEVEVHHPASATEHETAPEQEAQVDSTPEPEPEPVDDPFRIHGGDIPRLTAYEEIGRLDQEEAGTADEPLLSPLADSPDAILLSELPTREQRAPISPALMTAFYGVMSVLLVLGLFAQLAYFFRGAIVDWQPDLRPAFEQACRSLGCTVPLSRHLDALRVESSSLETDPEQPNRAKLKVSFSNRSSQVQAWPCFMLRLSDLQGSPLAQRVFWPKDYLPKTKREEAGMSPGSEQEFQLDLDLGGLSAAGYEIKPRYP